MGENNYLVIKHVCENCGFDMNNSLNGVDETKETFACSVCDYINDTYDYCVDCGEPITEADKQYHVGTGFCTHCFNAFFLDFDLYIESKIIDDLEEI